MAGTLQIGGVDLATHDTGTGEVTVKGNVVVPDGGTIGSASDTDAITLDASGNTTLGGNLVIPDSGTIGSASTNGAITIDSSGNTTATLSSSSNIKAPLNAGGSAPVYASRAWVHFRGTSTVSIRASGNVSSITDYGAGLYGVNFTTAMSDANYSCVGSCSWTTNSRNVLNVASGNGPISPTTSNIRIEVANYNSGSTNDSEYTMVSVFR